MSDGRSETLALRPQTVADFHAELLGTLDALGLPTRINPMPSEIPDAVPFDRDRTHAAYDPAAAHRFWQALVQADRVFKAFRARFVGKCSAVHFFWGSFDLAVTRFSDVPRRHIPVGCRTSRTGSRARRTRTR